MVSKLFVENPLPKTKKLIINVKFYESLTSILGYGIEKFGAKVTYDFYKKVMDSINKLPTMPDIHPKSRFIESTIKKTYRNILIEKYAVLYAVTAQTIQVITIYHQFINPNKIKSYL
ncbi:hypothetical protein AGMMS4956_06780 [Bacteroidia bacterium]|nr:hypothetical protein AGMMS4956_06780 [Bacteroidia bacterium]